jgi:hypothetical protein
MDTHFPRTLKRAACRNWLLWPIGMTCIGPLTTCSVVLVYAFADIASGRYRTYDGYCIRCYLLDPQGTIKVIKTLDTFPIASRYTRYCPPQSAGLYNVPNQLVDQARQIVADGAVGCNMGCQAGGWLDRGAAKNKSTNPPVHLLNPIKEIGDPRGGWVGQRPKKD